MKSFTPASRFTELDGKRTAFMDRCERYSQLTIRKIMPDDSYDQINDDSRIDWQSVGATAVNHMANRMMLTMFSPSRPNFRLDPSPELLAQAGTAGIQPEDIAAMLSTAEHKATKVLDKRKARPRLYEAIKHIIITGNALLRTDGEQLRSMGLRNYVVKRSITGRVIELVIKETVLFDELEQKVQEHPEVASSHKEGDIVDYYIWVKFQMGKYQVTQWVGDIDLGAQFKGAYGKDDCPYHAITWDLSDKADYGTGLVEDYAGELEALSTLSEALVQAAVLASEFRWLANPAGMTNANDLINSENGSVIPGVEGDISIVTSGKVGELEVMMKLAESHINRIGRGFLLNSAMTRNAERVTAEEIRLMAQELETGHGGVYSRLSIDLQEPVVKWVLKEVDVKIDDKMVEPIIITGLDALSRNGDLETLKMFLADFSAVSNLPPEAVSRLDIDAIARDLATGHGLVASKYVKTTQRVQAETQAAQQNQIQAAGATAAAETAGENIATPTQA